MARTGRSPVDVLCDATWGRLKQDGAEHWVRPLRERRHASR